MSLRVKKNFRYDDQKWSKAKDKITTMQRAGYDVDMTMVLTAAADQFVDETVDRTAARLGLTRVDGPVSAYRRPYPRGES